MRKLIARQLHHSNGMVNWLAGLVWDRGIVALIFLFLFYLLSACSAQKPGHAVVSFTPSPVPSIAQAAPIESTRLPAQTASSQPTSTSIPPTAAPTPEPTDCSCDFDTSSLIPPSAPVWSVPVVVGPSSVHSVPLGPDPYTGLYPLSWTEARLVNVEDRYTIDPSNGVVIDLPTATPVPDPYLNDEPVVYVSPDQTYSLTCDAAKNETRLTSMVDNSLIGTIPGSCAYRGDWAPDESAVAFLLSEPEFGTGFVWPVKDVQPIQLNVNASFSSVRWSPDSKKIMAQSSGLDLDTGVQANTAFIFSAQGKLITQFHVEDGKLLDGWLDWHTNDLIDVMMREGWEITIHSYYEWLQGVPLGSWSEYHLYPYTTQGLSLSPDQRWQVLDQGDYSFYTYGLYDLREKKGTILYSGSDQYFQFLGWSKDGQRFHFVNRPVEEAALTEEEMPFGWLSLDPKTITYTPVFVHALFVKYNPSEDLAWVVFPAKRSDGTVGMDGAIYDMAEQSLSDRNFISRKIYYDNPAHGDLVPVEWSHDGKRVVFLDEDGNLILFTVHGQKSVLGKNLFPEESGVSFDLYRFIWLPDDRWLIVHGDTSFWILDLISLTS